MDKRIEVLERKIGELEKQFIEMNKVNCCTKSEHSVDAILQNALDLTRLTSSNFKTNCKVNYQHSVDAGMCIKADLRQLA